MTMAYFQHSTPVQVSTNATAGRLAALDGVRAIAIIWVAIYHYCNFWAPSGKGDSLLPYGDALFWIPLAGAGGLGVSLFFMVSGFVILMTLQRTESIRNFAIRRSARIFPTLMLCGILTFAVSHAIGPERLQVGLGEFFFSLFSLPPEHIGKLFGYTDWQWLDGAYWSLWVELRFYATIGVMYFIFRKSWLTVWFSFQLLGAVLVAGYFLTEMHVLDRVGSLMFYEYIPLFSVGILAFLIHQRGFAKDWELVALGASFVHATLIALVFKAPENLTVGFASGHLLIFAILFGALFSQHSQRLLAWSPLVKLGRASYSFYLLHQVIGLSLLYWAGLFLPGWAVATFVLPIVVAGLIALSMIVFKHFEQPTNRKIVSRLNA